MWWISPEGTFSNYFSIGGLWISFPKLLWQLRAGAVSQTEQCRPRTQTSWNGALTSEMRKGTGKKASTTPEGGKQNTTLLSLKQQRTSPARQLESWLFCCHHFCFQIILNWGGEGWDSDRFSKRTSDVSSLLKMTEYNWWAWCLANSNFLLLRMLFNARTLFLDYWTPENNELAFSFGE